jgi:DNA-binding transcriptional LysR family regulator
MNFNQLQAFYMVAREGSFTAAAARLNISQPAVTRHVRELESLYRLRLFERTGRGVVLTEAGKMLLSFAQRIFSLASDAELTLHSMAHLKSGRLEVGTSRTAGTYYMPEILFAFKQRYPGVVVSLHSQNSEWVVDQILGLNLDVGVVVMALKHKHLVIRPFAEEQLVLMVPPGHPWARRQAVDARELNGKPLIMREKGSGTRNLILSELEKSAISPNVTMELASNEAIKQAVQQGVGLALVPRKIAVLEIQQGLLKALPVRGAELTLSFHVVYHKDKEVSPFIQAFLEVLEDRARG